MFNLFVVLIFTFFVAMILVYFIAKHDKNLAAKEKSASEASASPKKIDFRQFTKICMDLCENMKIDVQDVKQGDNDEVIIYASTDNDIANVTYLIVGFHLRENQKADNHRIQQISDQIISERLSKGIVITTGEFDESITRYPELAPMSFVDGPKLWEMVSKYKINFE
ncbi:MAG: restriction endonuclease [Deltaproteobacteria bacterium]|nr:restriction endonuclease [Deltaproteobacteria bacterium]